MGMHHLAVVAVVPRQARGGRRKLLVRTQPRDNPLSILLLAGMNHHLRRPLFLKHCLRFLRGQRHLEWFTRESMHHLAVVYSGGALGVSWQVV